ncbi:MAG: RecQ family ATP-dependent DNA helicase [Parcubacteria group bacterium]
MTKDIYQLLHQYFGYQQFRSGQEEAIKSITNKEDTVVVLPTGGGKSLIYQLSALALDGVTIVISPLISLMKDQVDSLNDLKIPATYINSSLPPMESEKRLEGIRNNEYKLIYIAPERFYNQNFITALQDSKVSLFAIDEAHCISQWGHDFRPSYMRLKQVIKNIGSPVVAALTATATPEVRKDIARQLDLGDNYNLIISGFARENLHFGAVEASDWQKNSLIIDAVKGVEGGSGIVYVGTRSKAEELVESLMAEGIQSATYHAGMDPSSREWVQDNFLSNNIQVVVATNAFGLGINKKDVRFVIHHDIPGTLEAYYQEAGRAGRDGKASFCMLFFSPKDRYLREFFIKGDNPSPQTIAEIHEILLDFSCEQESKRIMFTYSDLVSRLSDSVPEMAVGTSIKILEKEGLIQRNKEKNGAAYLKALAKDNELKDAISTRAKKQHEVLDKLVDNYYDEFKQGWNFSLEDLASNLNVKKDSISRLIKNLQEQDLVEYKPPFKGTELQILDDTSNVSDKIDFSVLEEKLEKSYEKLDKMENYVYNVFCRQKYILEYFGDPEIKDCGKCDNCMKANRSMKKDNIDYREKEYLI